MAKKPTIYDYTGKPINRGVLTREIASPTMAGARSPVATYPGDGLDPLILGAILREADLGNPQRYMALARTIEQRDPHYAGVLGTRKRSVSQLEITVEAGDDSAKAEQIADELRKWLKRRELQTELFHVLDAVGKGYSHTEIIWDFSEGQWWPSRLEWRDPAWFRFDRTDLTTPLMLDDSGAEVPYPPGKFIFARMQAMSGLPLSSGLVRLATWIWLFKAYTQRDWAIFTQTYGQPLRVGKFGAGASEKDQNTLFRAVADIGGDCAAIIPQDMVIEFVETKNLGSGTDLYERRCDWLDKQTSKAVIGQTATTDAEVGGLGSGKEHRQVQEDIERADANDLAAILTQQLAIPFVKLNYGDQPVYPSLNIGRPEEEDLAQWSQGIVPLVELGFPVPIDEVRKKFGIRAPNKGEEILLPSAVYAARLQSPPSAPNGMPPESAVKYPFNTQVAPERPVVAEQAEGPSAGNTAAHEILAETLGRAMQPQMSQMMARVEAIVEAATSLGELREALFAAFPELMTDAFVDDLAQGLAAAELGGHAALEEESNA